MNKTKEVIVTSCRMISSENHHLAMSRGIRIIDHNFLSFEYLDTKEIRSVLENESVPLVFTSKHGVIAFNRIFSGSASGRSCFCIEGETSAAADELGFDLLAKAEDATSLARMIIALQTVSLIFLCGSMRRHELPQLISEAGIEMRELKIYEKRMLLETVSESYDGLMFFSPSQVDAFLQNNEIDNSATLFCIGKTTAAHLKESGFSRIVLSESSSEKAMVDIVCKYYKNNE